MTARRTIAIGLGGAAAVIVAALVSVTLGEIVRGLLGILWPGHATTHVVFGGLAFGIALWVGRYRRIANGWAARGIVAVWLLALFVGATAVVEGIGAYPPLEVLHDVVLANVLALLLLLVGFLFIAAVGVIRLARRDPAAA